MSPRGIALMTVALLAAIVNFTARPLSEKVKVSELTLKVSALIVVLICVSLLMIFGK